MTLSTAVNVKILYIHNYNYELVVREMNKEISHKYVLKILFDPIETQ